jgi:AcrR family transcriptional regulator
MARVGLDAGAVVVAAAELIDDEGLEALTLSALASRVGVKPPSLYAHVGGLDDLRRRLATLGAELLADAIAPAAAGLARGEALQALGRSYRDWVLAHPGLYAAMEAYAPPQDPAVGRVLELVLAVLRGYGLEGDAAIHAARSLRAALHGFTALEAGGGFGIPVAPQLSFEWMLAALDRGLGSALED